MSRSELVGALAGVLVAVAPLGCLHLEVEGVAMNEASACDPVRCDAPETDPAAPAALHELSFPSEGALLNGVVYVPAGAGPHPVAILLHGYPGYERNGDLAHALRRAGFVVLIFHYRGSWGSPGTFAFASTLEDAAAAVAFVRSPAFAKDYRADGSRVAVVGHSMGGFVAIQTAAHDAEIDCAASLAGANLGLLGRAAAVDPATRARMEQALGGWSGPIRLAPRHEPVAELVANADRFDLTQSVTALAERPVLLVAGSRDDVTPPAQHHDPLVAALAAADAEHAEAIVLDADHAFSSQRIALAEALVAWLQRSCR